MKKKKDKCPLSYKEEWSKVCEMLKNSRADLSRIKIVVKENDND